MDIAPEMKPIKTGVRDAKAERDALFRFNPNPEGGEGIDEGRPT